MSLSGTILDHLGETTFRDWPTRSGCFARVRTGRLVEVRIGRLASTEDVEWLDTVFFAAMNVVGAGAVICADHRFASPLPSYLADAWAGSMRRNNRTLARSAILLDPANATFNLQIERIVRCAGSDERRMYVDREGLYEWLDGRLTADERAALREFLDGRA
jgi:hypothetical protein